MAVGDNLLSTWATFLYELRGKVVQLFPTEAPLLAECAHRSMTGGQSGCTSGVVCAPGSARVCQALN